MSLPWIKVFVDLPRHTKSDELEAALDLPRAWTHVVELWLWAADNKPDGDLSGVSPKVIAKRAGYAGDPEAFVQALKDVGFLDPDGRLHDWDELEEAHVKEAKKRERERENKRRQRRARKEAEEARRGDVPPVPPDVHRDVHVDKEGTKRVAEGTSPWTSPGTPSYISSLSSGVRGGVGEEGGGRLREVTDPGGEDAPLDPTVELIRAGAYDRYDGQHLATTYHRVGQVLFEVHCELQGRQAPYTPARAVLYREAVLYHPPSKLLEAVEAANLDPVLSGREQAPSGFRGNLGIAWKRAMEDPVSVIQVGERYRQESGPPEDDEERAFIEAYKRRIAGEDEDRMETAGAPAPARMVV